MAVISFEQLDLGPWTAFTPTLVSEAGGALGTGNTVVGAYKQIGKTVIVRMSAAMGASGIGTATQVSISLPVACLGPMNQILNGKNATSAVGVFGDIGVVGFTKALLNVTATGAVGVANSQTTYISGTYEAA